MTNGRRTTRLAVAIASIAMYSPMLAHAQQQRSAPGRLADPTAAEAAVKAAFEKYKDLKEGKNADYIPALAKVDPNLYGIVLVTVDGKVYSAGDTKTEVSIQSISK